MQQEAPAGRLAGKVAIVSGAASGMGLEHVRAFAREGAAVLGFDLAFAGDAGLRDELASGRYRQTLGDVTSRQDWERVVRECEQAFGPPSVLVNNAGIAAANRVESIAEAEYRRILDVNQVGAFLGMQSVIAPMRRAGGGSIVNVSSTAGLVGFEDNFAYVATKWALRGMTRAAALELAGDGIRVNAVCPGETDTPLLRSDPTALPPEASPFGRWAQPAEVSAAVVFLASDESSYLSGTDIVIDAGQTSA